jgi:thiamine biosynthesis protein ThiI
LTILVAYGEIALKSRRVRRGLEILLARQITEHLRRRGFSRARALKRFGRIYVEGVTAEEARIVANVFGVVSAMPAKRTGSDIDSILKLAVEMASERMVEGQSFAVRPNVVGEHPYSSRDLAVEVGSAVLRATGDRGVHVNLTCPDFTLYLEVRDVDAFAYTEVFRGVGGLPYGSQGRMVSLFSGGIDSPVAAWLMMKRGVEVLPLLMDQRPYVGESYIERAESANKAIADYVPEGDLGLHVAPFGEVMARIVESPVLALRCVLCKRSMYKVATAFAEESNAKGIVTGESLGQVASQTLANLYVLDNAVGVPVIRPIIGLDKVEIEEIARSIGTYGITARTVEGCTIVPNRVSTRARLELVLELEEELGLEELCSRAADGIKTI